MLTKKIEKCAFCGREMKDLFRADIPGVYICHECIEAGHKMIMEMQVQKAQKQAERRQKDAADCHYCR